jgi:HAD superfamily hydrolase (TIGR01549 family)
MTVKGVIFDVGGTLKWGNQGRFTPVNAWTAANWLRSRGFALEPNAFADTLRAQFDLPKEGEDYKQLNTTLEALERVSKAFGVPLAEAELHALERAFNAPQICGAMPLPEVTEVVKALAGRVRLAIISNTRSHQLIEGIVTRFGVRDYFDPFLTSAGFGYRKPSPRLFKAVLDAWGFAPDEVAMIGDSLRKDVMGAKAVGMRAIWLKLDATEREGGEADAIAELPKDLLGILQAWGVAR